MADVLSLEKVSKSYGKGELRTQVLFDIDLAFEEGSFNSIIGQSGSGKSTLLNILGTLDRPDSGAVRVGGKRADRMGPAQLAALRGEFIGFVFQFHYLLPEFTALENVLLPHQIARGRVTSRERARAEELLDMVGIARVKNNLATKMSGGQQQRTAIARALMNGPKVVLADEPTGNLDSDSTDNIYALFRDVNRKLGTTFVIVTHNRTVAEKTDRIVEMADGRIRMDVRR